VETQGIIVAKGSGPEPAEGSGSHTSQPLPWRGHLISVLSLSSPNYTGLVSSLQNTGNKPPELGKHGKKFQSFNTENSMITRLTVKETLLGTYLSLPFIYKC